MAQHTTALIFYVYLFILHHKMKRLKIRYKNIYEQLQ